MTPPAGPAPSSRRVRAIGGGGLHGWLDAAVLPLIAGLITMLAVELTTSQIESRAIAEAHRQRLSDLALRATAAAERVHRFADSADLLLDLVRIRQHLMFTTGQSTATTEITNQLMQYAGSARMNDAVMFWIDAQGVNRWSSQDIGLGILNADREYFQYGASHPGRTFIPTPVVGRTSHVLRIQFARGFADAHGQLLGVAVISTDAARLGDLLAPATPLDEGWISLARAEDGEVIGHVGGGRPMSNNHDHISESLMRLLAGSSGGALEMTSGVTGQPLLSGYRLLPVHGLVAVASEPIAAVDAAVIARQRPLARALAAALPLIAGLLMLLLTTTRARRRERQRVADMGFLRDAEMLARRRVENLIRDLSTALFAGEAGPHGGFTPCFISDNLERICRLPRFGPTERALLRAFVREVGKTGEASTTIEAVGHDGQPVWLQISGRRGAERTRGRFELIGKISDITREHAMLDQLLSASKLATLGDLATGIAHELNQPIAVMSFAAENAAADLDLPPDEAAVRVRKRLRLIVDQAMRARHIVEHLRAFGRHDDGALAAVPVVGMVEGALLLTQSALYQEQIAVSTELAEDLPPVLGRAAPLEQALANLLIHARDGLATVQGHRQITITADIDSGQLRLRVADNGPVVPPDQRASIFEPFAAGQPAGQAGHSATAGLGLWLCHGTITRFGGTLKLICPPEGGSAFEIRLTLARPTALSAPRFLVETVR